ncbi:MFS transporter [Nocardiopsis terrae]|uniref:DHA2 family multidrug resistance protein-like MFS transporter n=1 Tax=Nocardiopsis terrae TaxID=372655 RepID=A0ABR9HB23_9ACTN|nr:MFS transporter [Nocardiopsis terrae]MBE1456231.1 DHA2 family multidrug resistance protein-like MFS transporter [Nocardiopsis terrae]GHC78034.1 MFS transporter [Nocardiopsis terrae]
MSEAIRTGDRSADDRPLSRARRWLVLAAVSAGLLLISVDMTILYTALPTLSAQLDAGASDRLWIINAYPLVMAGLLLGAGTLGDRVGHKRMYLIGLVLFGAASLTAAYAPDPAVLIAARAFLAVGASAMMPATLSLIRITFTDERERGIAIGIWGTMAMVGAAIGPIAGGALLEYFWWGSVFLVNVPIVLAALVLAAVVAPGGSGSPDRPWDLLASVQVMAGLVGVVYAIKEATGPEPSALAVAAALAAAVLGFWTFVRRQRGQAHPLIDFALFRDPRILIGVLAAGMGMFALAGVQLVLTQRLQLVLGYSPLHSGLTVAATALGALPVGVTVGALLYRLGARPVMGAGLLATALGTAGVLASASAPLAWTVAGLLVMGAGTGAAMTAASAAIVGSAPAHRAGMAASVEEVSYELGSLTGVAVLGSLMAAVYTRTVALPGQAPASAAEGLDEARAAAEGMDTAGARALLEAATQAFDNGYRATLVVAATALLAASAFSFLYKRGAPVPPSPDQDTDRAAAPGE